LLRQEALWTRIARVDEAEGNQHLKQARATASAMEKLVRVMQGYGLSQPDVRTWLRHQLTVRTFIERRMRLFVHVTENQIV
jgi:hypothetical protein